METFILILVGALGIALGFSLGSVGQHKRFSDLVNKERFPLKERRKSMIIKHIKDRKRITNAKTRELLGISDTTATRYFDELEEEGRIVQRGESGSSVFYELA